MMLAGQAGLDDFAQSRAHHSPERFLRQKVVTHQILSHSPVPNKRFIGYNTRAGKVEVIKMKGVQASVARCLRTPP